MNIKLKQSKHKTLFGIFKPLLFKVIKPVLVKAFEKQIRQSFSEFDALAWRIYTEEQKIEADLRNNPDPQNAMNIYTRYSKAIQAELLNKKKKAEDMVADKTMNVAVTRDDSKFKDIHLPGGISSRTTEFRDQARQGDSWRNDVFNLGSASPSTNLPSAAPITRKSPHAHRRTLRDRDAASHTSRDSGLGYQAMPENTGFGVADQMRTQQYDGAVLNKFTRDDPVGATHYVNEDPQYGRYTGAPGVTY